MATISTLYKAGPLHMTRNGADRVSYMVEYELDYSKALTAKGSALAATDVIECIYIPAGTVVKGAWLGNKVAADSTALTLHLGYGVDNDEWAASFDAKGAAGTYSADLNSDTTYKIFAAADTIDVVLATLTGTLTSGKVRVMAELLDVSDVPAGPGAIAQLGS